MPPKKRLKEDGKQKKLTWMDRKAGPSTYPTPTCNQEDRRQRERKKRNVDLVQPKNVDESILPVSFEDFRKYTNIMEVGMEEIKRAHPRTYKERAKDQSHLLKCARDFYVIFFTEPKYRRNKPLNILQISDDCPHDIVSRIFATVETRGHKEAHQHGPSQPKKTIPCFTLLNEVPKTDDIAHFPVPLHTFKKYSYYDVIVDEILKDCSLANNDRYERLKMDFETRERVLFNYYRAFYIHPGIRESYKLRLKPCPAHMRNRILQFPEAGSATEQHQSRGISKVVEVSAPAGVQHDSPFHSGVLALAAESNAPEKMPLVQLDQKHQTSNAFTQVDVEVVDLVGSDIEINGPHPETDSLSSSVENDGEANFEPQAKCYRSTKVSHDDTLKTASKENITSVETGSPKKMKLNSPAASSSPPNITLAYSRMNSVLTELSKNHSQNSNVNESRFPPIDFSEFIGGTNIMDIVRNKFNVENGQRSEKIARQLYEQFFTDAQAYAGIFDDLMMSYKLIKKIRVASKLRNFKETERSATSTIGEENIPTDLNSACNSQLQQSAEEAVGKTAAAASMQRTRTSSLQILTEYTVSAGIELSKQVEELAQFKSQLLCPTANAGKARHRVHIQSVEVITPAKRPNPMSDPLDAEMALICGSAAALESTQKPVETPLPTKSQSDVGTSAELEIDGIAITPTVTTTQAPIEMDDIETSQAVESTVYHSAMETQTVLTQESEPRHATQPLDQLSIFDYDAFVKTPTKETSTQNGDSGPKGTPMEAGFSQPTTCSTQSLTPSLPHSGEQNMHRPQIQNVSPNIFSSSSSGSSQPKVLQSDDQPPSSGRCGNHRVATMPSTTPTQMDALPHEEHIMFDPLDAEMALICKGTEAGDGVKIKTEPSLLNNLQFAIDDHSEIVCVGPLSQDAIVIVDEEIEANDDFFDSKAEQTLLQHQLEIRSPQRETPESTLGVICEGQRISSSCETEIASQHQDIVSAVPTTTIHQFLPLKPTTISTTAATVCGNNVARRKSPATVTASMAAQKITDNVPQLTHGFRPLPLVTLTKNALLAAVVAPNMETSSSTAANSSNSTGSFSTSQALATDCTLFNNTSLLRKLDQQPPAPITTTIAASKSSKSTVGVISSCPATAAAQQKVNDIDHSGRKLQKTLLCRSLLKFDYFEELLEQHIAAHELPTMSIGQRYMQALIHCGGHTTKVYGGDLLRFLLGQCPAEVLRDLHFVLSDLREYHYKVAQKGCENRVDDLRMRVVQHFLQSSPAFCHCLLKFECHTREFGYLQALTPSTDDTLTRRPHRALIEGLKPAILAGIAKLKVKL